MKVFLDLLLPKEKKSMELQTMRLHIENYGTMIIVNTILCSYCIALCNLFMCMLEKLILYTVQVYHLYMVFAIIPIKNWASTPPLRM